MLLEIIPSKVAPVTDTTSAEVIQRFYDLGIYPDWWKLEPFATDTAWESACAAITRNDPHVRGASSSSALMPAKRPCRLALQLAARQPLGERLRHRPHDLWRCRARLAEGRDHDDTAAIAMMARTLRAPLRDLGRGAP